MAKREGAVVRPGWTDSVGGSTFECLKPGYTMDSASTTAKKGQVVKQVKSNMTSAFQ